jgi:Flp pilus assembly pilin Flp
MAKLPDNRGLGLVEWILIVILVLLVLVTLYYLLEPALVIFWQNIIQSIQQ